MPCAGRFPQLEPSPVELRAHLEVRDRRQLIHRDRARAQLEICRQFRVLDRSADAREQCDRTVTVDRGHINEAGRRERCHRLAEVPRHRRAQRVSIRDGCVTLPERKPAGHRQICLARGGIEPRHADHAIRVRDRGRTSETYWQFSNLCLERGHVDRCATGAPVVERTRSLRDKIETPGHRRRRLHAAEQTREIGI